MLNSQTVVLGYYAKPKASTELTATCTRISEFEATVIYQEC